MKVEVEVPDILFQTHAERYFQERLSTGDRWLAISPDARRELEAVFETTLDDEKKLIRLVRNLCSYKIEHVEFTFAPDELARISMQATFHGRTRDQFVAEMVNEIKSRMLEQV